jgi:hypothetical protein
MGDVDKGIEAVRRAREEISREHNNDPRRLVEYYMALQERHKDRLIDGASQQADPTARPSAGR